VTVQYIAQRLALGAGLVAFKGAHRYGDRMLADQPQVPRFDLSSFSLLTPTPNWRSVFGQRQHPVPLKMTRTW
jgi:murein DD-endopeptidase MepM/ murein hydrolase activator NlpD